jgi:hypothetical protein
MSRTTGFRSQLVDKNIATDCNNEGNTKRKKFVTVMNYYHFILSFYFI